MTDLATADAPTVSTTLEPNDAAAPSGAGAPRTLDDDKADAKPLSLRDTVAAAVKDDKEAPKPDADQGDDKEAGKTEPAKGGEKPQQREKVDAKGDDAKDEAKGAQRGADGKFAAKQAEGEAAPGDVKSEVKPNGHIEPPKNFLPDAKETWRNTPRAVQRDIDNAIKTHEAEVTRYREVAERYEPIRQYDELVRQNGRAGLHETLAEVKQLEDLMEANPIAALNQVLLRAGPRKADGQPVSLFELAQHIVNSGQDNYSRAVSTVPQQQQQEDPRIAQLSAQIASMQQQQVAATVIEPFKAGHPRYEELQHDIAFFLQSGKIPTSLSPHDRLEAAYDMAARINPASHANDAAETKASPEPRDRAVDDLSGSKSIKSAPGAVSAEMEPDRGGSIRDLLSAELKRAKRS